MFESLLVWSRGSHTIDCEAVINPARKSTARCLRFCLSISLRSTLGVVMKAVRARHRITNIMPAVASYTLANTCAGARRSSDIMAVIQRLAPIHRRVASLRKLMRRALLTHALRNFFTQDCTFESKLTKKGHDEKSQCRCGAKNAPLLNRFDDAM